MVVLCLDFSAKNLEKSCKIYAKPAHETLVQDVFIKRDGSTQQIDAVLFHHFNDG
ncbi:hypothetical protein SAMN05720766_11829 [Fibrobacter sp. UWH9]|nr:hypothetical protein SAMN05720766_11829 [Fibrobacter sp. UWH9]SHK77844.1 hypothetical protein SAMN05720765_10529 [Fibrobacter sp. UWH6]SHK82781.1 hypothetical protein SAMN05720764_104150 [Fibrobacter sp. UWH5]